MTYISTILWNIIIIKHVIPERYQKPNDGHQFLLQDSCPGEDPRMIIYATQRNLQILSTARHWLMDGTFKIVPELFSQLYTIHALCGSQSIPCIYGLLPNKRQVMYMSFLQKLKEADATLNPDTVTTDYEVATINALQDVFPDTYVHGCLYHLSQCLCVPQSSGKWTTTKLHTR